MRLPNTPSVLLITMLCAYACQCNPQQTAPDQPLIAIADAPALQITWTQTPEQAPDPTEQCVSCHETIVEKYRASKKYQTSRSVDKSLAASMANVPVKAPEYKVLLTDKKQLTFEERIPFEDRKRSATASLHIGSKSRAFSGYVRGEQRLLPLYFNDKETHFWKVSGYRQEAVVPFETETVQACSGCHGLNEEKPSAHGIPCGGCHGKLDGHVTDGQHTTDSSNRANLDSFEGQRRICGQCHTHAKGRWYRHLADMTSQPKEHTALFKDLVIYGRIDHFDERGSDHGHHFSKSRCFGKQPEQTPKCTACHDPHQASDLVMRTRNTCLSCHTSFKPCLNLMGRAPNADCGQCHMSRLYKEKQPHNNAIIHQIVRAPTTPEYWKSIQTRSLTPQFSALQSNASSTAEKSAERALVSLEFTRNRDKPTQAKKLEAASAHY